MSTNPLETRLSNKYYKQKIERHNLYQTWQKEIWTKRGTTNEKVYV